MFLDKKTGNNMGRTCEQCGGFKENGEKTILFRISMNLMKYLEKTLEIFHSHDIVNAGRTDGSIE